MFKTLIKTLIKSLQKYFYEFSDSYVHLLVEMWEKKVEVAAFSLGTSDHNKLSRKTI